jgi:hypothetical protein
MFIRVILLRFLFVKSLRKNHHNGYYQRRIYALSIFILIRAHIGEMVDEMMMTMIYDSEFYPHVSLE